MHVYYTNIQSLTQEAYEIGLSRLSAERQERLLRSKADNDRRLRLAASLLLYEGLQRQLGGAIPFPALAYGAQGKPYLADYPEVHFSLSHAGDYALCALSDTPVGADLQDLRPDSLRIMKRFYKEEEQAYVLREELTHTVGRPHTHATSDALAEDIRYALDSMDDEERAAAEQRFFAIWSSKEAYIKLTGKGLSADISAITADLSAKKIADAYLAEPLTLPGYACAICSYEQKALEGILVEFLDLGISLVC